MSRRLVYGLTFLVWMNCLGMAGKAVAADERIERALKLPEKTRGGLYRDQLKVEWLPEDRGLWYRVQTGKDSFEFVFVETHSGQRHTGPNAQSLQLPEPKPARTSEATVEIRRSVQTGDSLELLLLNRLKSPVRLHWINPEGKQIAYGEIAAGQQRTQPTYAGHVWRISTLTDETLAVVAASWEIRQLEIDGPGRKVTPQRPQPRRARGDVSPDRVWRAGVEGGRVQLQNLKSGAAEHLPTDFDKDTPFQPGISWSPDSQSFVVCCADAVIDREVTIVNSRPEGSTQPELKKFRYPKPGDPLPRPRPVLFRVTDHGGVWVPVATDLFDNPFTESRTVPIRWAADGSEFYFSYNQRGHQVYRILAVNTKTGEVRNVVEETSPTFIDYTKKTWQHWLQATDELLWMSERDGWCQLWMYEISTGRVKHQVSCGEWAIREVLLVNETEREIWFLAGGVAPQQSPYHTHLCRVNFDGSGFQQLTASDGVHRIEFSPTREFFIAEWSRVDHPPVHELRRSRDGKLICVLETADARELLGTGWTLPERFAGVGRDGVTPIHGVIIKPSHFDPGKTYPVVEEIYAGPHGANTPKTFGRLMRQHQMAELGFIVIQVDGMGTNFRSKAFHDVCWKNLKDAGFPDRIAWIQQAGASRPWMDLSRVGIYGGSAGGQNAMRALLDHPEFYHVAVADCGCHDNRMDKIWWNEQWMGWPVDESYTTSSNVEDAHKLQGHLLLIVGELDTNVDPASTMQVVAALQRADKRFDFMPIAGTGHGAAERPYGFRLRMEFLVKHLLEPPTLHQGSPRP